MIFICTRYVYIINYIVIKFNWRKSVNMHNNFYHKGKKILFTSMAVAALSVIAANPVAAKAAESQGEQPVKPAETKSTTNNDKDQKTDIEDHTAEDDSQMLSDSIWNKNKNSYSYDEKTKTLTIKAGTIDNSKYTSDKKPINPAQIAWNIDGVNTDEIQTIKIEDKVAFKGDASSLFAGLPNLKEIVGLKNLDTTGVTSMKQMFASDPKLTSLDLSNLDTSKVTDMMGMFFDDEALSTLDVSNFKTDLVEDMSYMFSNDSSLTKIDGLKNFNTGKVTKMWEMFKGDKALTSLDISNFTTPSEPVPVKDADGNTLYSEPAETDMLKGLDSLTSLKLGKNNIIKSSGLNTKGTWNLNGKNLTSDEFASQFDGSKDANTFTLTPASTPSTPSTPVTPSTPSTPVAPSTPSTPVVPSNNVTPKPNTNGKKGVKRIVTHNAYIFNQNGVRVSGEFYVGDSITTYGTKYINGKKFYDLGNDRFVKANNVTGINRKLKHNAYIYTKKNKKVKRLGRKVLKKNKKVRTYGGAVKMHNKWYYIIGKNQFVKKANFR